MRYLRLYLQRTRASSVPIRVKSRCLLVDKKVMLLCFFQGLPTGLQLGCPRISLRSETEAKRSEIAKLTPQFRLFRFEAKQEFRMQNEINQKRNRAKRNKQEAKLCETKPTLNETLYNTSARLKFSSHRISATAAPRHLILAPPRDILGGKFAPYKNASVSHIFNKRDSRE